MRDAWRIGVGLELRMTGKDTGGPGGEEMPAKQAIPWLRLAASDGLRGRALVLDIAEALTAVSPSRRTTLGDALGTVERALAEGRLRVVVHRPEYEGGGKGPEVEQPRSRQEPVREQKTFVAIQLLSDEAEPKPVPFKRYRITLPDHTVREGMLDQYGKAMIVGIDPGTCKVSFPDFDASDWKAA